MAFTNGTVKVHMEFVTAGGSYSNATNISLKIYTLDQVLIETVPISGADKISTGVYEKDYTVPVGYTEVLAEVVGTIGTSVITGFAEIDTIKTPSANPVDFVATVKTLLLFDAGDTSKDAYLTAIIPYMIDFIQTYCNNEFRNDAGVIDLPLGLNLVLAKLCQYHMKNPTVSDELFQGFTTKISTSYPKSILTTLDSYKIKNSTQSREVILY